MNSLSLKVLLAYVAGAILSIVLIVLATIAAVSTRGDWLLGADVVALTQDMSAMLQFDSEGMPTGVRDGDGRPVGPGGTEDDFAAWLYESLKQETAYRVLDASGKVVLTSAAGAAFWSTSTAARRLERGRFEFEHDGVAMRGATEPVVYNGKVWYFQNAVSTRFLDLGYSAFAVPFTATGIVLFSVVLLFVFGACAFITLKYTLKPLREISESAAAISPRSLHARLHTRSVPTEIRPLVDSFNHVLDRLERGYRLQQGFLATAAHELKTPLALIRGQVELGVDKEGRQVLLQDISRMGRQVQQLLHLAEASEVQNYEFALVDVEGLLLEVMNFLGRLASQQGVQMELVVTPGLVLQRADRGALFTLLKNLLENAIQHSRAGVVVRLRADSNLLSVQDEGPGVSAEDLPKIFTRFWRSAERRDFGAGLGLSICQEIALAHGWDLRVRRGEPGMIFSLVIDPDALDTRVGEN